MTRSVFNTYHKRFMTIEDRFLEKTVVVGDCWEWQGSVTVSGYGQFSIRSRGFRAHRIAYELFVGPIPNGLLVCHKCDNTKCVNPNHLFVGSSQDNTDDMIAKGRTGGMKGEAHPFAKLSEEDICSIRVMTGTCKEIGAQFDIGPMQVSRIKRKQRWGHVP